MKAIISLVSQTKSSHWLGTVYDLCVALDTHGERTCAGESFQAEQRGEKCRDIHAEHKGTGSEAARGEKMALKSPSVWADARCGRTRPTFLGQHGSPQM